MVVRMLVSTLNSVPCDIIGQRYKVEDIIGKGNFGDLRKGVDTECNEQIAVKIDKNDTPAMLEREYKFYKALFSLPGIPRVYYLGYCDKYHAMVMELLGPSLDDLFVLCEKKFSLQTLIQITVQLLTRLEDLHTRGVLHGDIKPQNFLIGRKSEGKDKIIYVIDFGLTKQYCDDNGMHISYKTNRKPTGTPRYMSINTHLNRTQSRRDDLESLGYVLLYLAKGSLPWQGVGKPKQSSEDRYKTILELKQSIPLKTLCNGKPEEFVKYFEYVRGLEFEEEPDYEYLKKLFNDLYLKNGFYGNRFDWTTKLK